MIPLLLAQSTAPVSHDSIGTFVVIAVLLTKWLWDYRRNSREEDDRKEPKSNPPLHERFISRPEYASDQEVIDERLTAATESRGRMHKEIEGHSQRLASLEKGERHTEQMLQSIDLKLTTLLKRAHS